MELTDVERDDITRSFWALLMGGKISADGQIPGFRKFWNKLTPWAQRECDRYAHWTWRKIERDGRDVDECIAEGVHALRIQLADEPPEVVYPPPSSADVDAIVKAIVAHVEASGPVAVMRKPSAVEQPPLFLTDADVERARAMANELRGQ